MKTKLAGIGIPAILALFAACSAGAGDSGSECDDLATCCTEMASSASESVCLQVVATNDATACSSQLATYVSASTCAGTATASGSGSATCATLAVCCGEIVDSSEQAQCKVEVASKNDAVCAAAQASYQQGALCLATTTGSSPISSVSSSCTTLAGCCDALPTSDPDRSMCSAYVSNGNESNCTFALSYYQCGSTTTSGSSEDVADSAGETEDSGDSEITEDTGDSEVSEGSGDSEVSEDSGDSASGGSAGNGGATGGCAALSSCCAAMPSAQRTSCDDLVSEGDDSACDASLTDAQIDGFCSG
jgi:hypothetical protein